MHDDSRWTSILVLSGLWACAVALGCTGDSEEIGATVGDTEGSGSGDGGASTGSGSDESGSATSTSGSTAEGTTGDEAGTSDTAQACWDQWAMPQAVVDATERPSSEGLRLEFEYANGTVTLTALSEETIVRSPDGPFNPDDFSGTWVELRDANDQVLYTRSEFQLIPESVEVHGPISNLFECPEVGSLRLRDYANDPAATHVVFFQEPIDGQMTFETVELLRFELP
jgi:hypothetical protein